MGGLIHLPQLAVQPEQAPDPLSQYGKLQSIQALSAQRQQQQALMPGQLQAQQQQLQEGLLDNQMKQRQVAQGKALDAAYQGALTPDPVTGKLGFDQAKVLNSVTASGNGSLVPQLTETFNNLDQKKATLLEAKQKIAAAGQDYAGSLAAEVKAAGYTPGAAGLALAHLSEVDPNTASQLKQQFQQNPDSIKGWVDQTIAGSPKQREVAAQEMAAQARKTQAEKQPNETGAAADQEYQDLLTKKNMGQPLSAQDQASIKAYEARKTLGPRTTFNLQANGVQGGGTPATNSDGTPLSPDQQYQSFGAKSGVVKGIVEGRQTAPSGSAQRSPYWQDVMNKVYQVDPQWSEQRAQVRKAFTTGTDGRNIGNLNTASVHLDALGEISKALDNGTFQPGNALWNKAKTMFGGAAPTDYEGLKQAVAGEMDAALHGTSTIPGRDEIAATMPAKNAPGQMTGIIDTNLKTIGAKLQTYKERYEQQNPGDTVYSPVLPSAQAVFAKHAAGQSAAASGGSTQGASSGLGVSLAAAKQLPQNKGKSDAEVKQDIESHGHKVVE
jgi:hypothetical protein